MYEQSTVSRRKSHTRRRPVRRQERVRLAQLAVCLVLFLVIFLGKGIFPQKLGQAGEDLRSLISTDLDLRQALSSLGSSLAGGKTALSDLGAFCMEVFGAEELESDPAELTSFRLPRPEEGVLSLERGFLGQRAGTPARTLHYTKLSSLGLEPSPAPVEPEEAPPVDPVPVTEPEEPPAVPAAGTVIRAAEYTGPELPENYTMDQLSLGELETAAPVLGHLNSGFGYRDHPISGKNAPHGGVDIGGQMGDPIAAFAAGTVEYTGESDDCGLYLQLDHGNGVKSFYAHCSKVEVAKGQAVSKGEVIARIGSTGISTGPHLHFELKYNDVRLNPAYYVEFLEQ